MPTSTKIVWFVALVSLSLWPGADCRRKYRINRLLEAEKSLHIEPGHNYDLLETQPSLPNEKKVGSEDEKANKNPDERRSRGRGRGGGKNLSGDYGRNDYGSYNSYGGGFTGYVPYGGNDAYHPTSVYSPSPYYGGGIPSIPTAPPIPGLFGLNHANGAGYPGYSGGIDQYYEESGVPDSPPINLFNLGDGDLEAVVRVVYADSPVYCSGPEC
jgi:hypothetical protein